MIYFEKKLCLLIKFSKEQDFSLDKGFISFFVLFTFRLVTEKHILILYFLKKKIAQRNDYFKNTYHKPYSP